MNLNNMEIRKAIERKRLKYYELARALEINPSSLSRWLQVEMSPDRKQKVMKAIEEIKV